MSLYRFLFRGGNAADLAALNEIPLRNEGISALDAFNLKIGDGVTRFNSLRWLLPPFVAASGTNTITATFAAKPVLFDGLTVYIRAAGANTGAVTFNPNGLGAVAVTKYGGTALAADDIVAAGHELILRYRSSVPTWELLNPGPPAAGSGSFSTGTSFPGGPSSNDIFYRTDLDLWCFYDGTRWLTIQEYTVAATTDTALPFTASGGILRGFFQSDRDIYVSRADVEVQVGATNTGAAYWTFTFDTYTNVLGATSLLTGSTASLTANQIHGFSASGVLLAANTRAFALVFTKVGAASNCFPGATITYRKVIP